MVRSTSSSVTSRGGAARRIGADTVRTANRTIRDFFMTLFLSGAAGLLAGAIDGLVEFVAGVAGWIPLHQPAAHRQHGVVARVEVELAGLIHQARHQLLHVGDALE